jgi:hypothetical protein
MKKEMKEKEEEIETEGKKEPGKHHFKNLCY